MPQHRDGKAMSQPTARTMWHLDPEFWSANRAAHRFANGYELVVFDMPAANCYPATIGWELFGGLDYMTLVASGQDASFGEEGHLRGGAGSSVDGSQTSAEGLGLPVRLPVHVNEGRTLRSYA
jgi:hypothetical protein